MTIKKVIICGLPSSGKTTFLAALWYLLFNKDIPTTLSLRALPQNRGYLNMISDDWCRFKKFDRTQTDVFEEISLQLMDGLISLDLHVPDMSGEKWRAIWEYRIISKKTAEWTRGDAGVILFINPESINHPVDIATHGAMSKLCGPGPEDGEIVEWSAKDSPTQVILVDILQALVLPPIRNKGLRLSVIISAWDKVEAMQTTPDDFLQSQLPLLHQFLKFSGYFSDYKIFGISAQGGDLESEADSERIKQIDVPSERIKVISNNQTSHDITLPIHWLIV